jgi:hypothetical protein
VFVVLLALADAVGAVPSRWRGVLVGIAAAVKLTPLLFVVFFLLAGRRREAAPVGRLRRRLRTRRTGTPRTAWSMGSVSGLAAAAGL